MHYFVPFEFCNHYAGEVRNGCFVFVVFLISCSCYGFLPLPRGAVGWSVMCDCGSSRSYSLTFWLSENESSHYDEDDPLVIYFDVTFNSCLGGFAFKV